MGLLWAVMSNESILRLPSGVGVRGREEWGGGPTEEKLSGPSPLQLFEGNMHYDTPDIRRFDPVPAQYVRVYPERWSPAGIGMRLEVLGCDWTGKACFPSPGPAHMLV